MQCLTETDHPRPSRITGKRSKSAGSGGDSAPSPTESGRHPPSDDLSELDRIRMVSITAYAWMQIASYNMLMNNSVY